MAGNITFFIVLISTKAVFRSGWIAFQDALFPVSHYVRYSYRHMIRKYCVSPCTHEAGFFWLTGNSLQDGGDVDDGRKSVIMVCFLKVLLSR